MGSIFSFCFKYLTCQLAIRGWIFTIRRQILHSGQLTLVFLRNIECLRITYMWPEVLVSQGITLKTLAKGCMLCTKIKGQKHAILRIVFCKNMTLNPKLLKVLLHSDSPGPLLLRFHSFPLHSPCPSRFYCTSYWIRCGWGKKIRKRKICWGGNISCYCIGKVHIE